MMDFMGFVGDFIGFHGDFMGFVGDFMGFLTVFDWGVFDWMFTSSGALAEA